MIWAGVISAVCFGVLVFLLTVAFFRQIRTDLYSYNTIIYAGFALFTLSVFVTHVYIAVLGFLHPYDFHFMQILYTLVHSSKNYMFITSPVLIVFSAALFVSNVALIRHEGLRFANLLGIILALALVPVKRLSPFWTSEVLSLPTECLQEIFLLTQFQPSTSILNV